MANKIPTLSVSLSYDDIEALNFCYFVLNFLNNQPVEVDEVSEGFHAVVATACEKLAKVQSVVFDAQMENMV